MLTQKPGGERVGRGLVRYCVDPKAGGGGGGGGEGLFATVLAQKPGGEREGGGGLFATVLTQKPGGWGGGERGLVSYCVDQETRCDSQAPQTTGNI